MYKIFCIFSFSHLKSELLPSTGLTDSIKIFEKDPVSGVEHLGLRGTHGGGIVLLTLVSTEARCTLNCVGEVERAMCKHAAIANLPSSQFKGALSKQITVPATVFIINSETQSVSHVDRDLSKLKGLRPPGIVIVGYYDGAFALLSVRYQH